MEKFERQKEKYKICLVAILLVVGCVITYYFHRVLGICAIFTHFFYIPIILACLWWRRKGLVVAIFFSALLVISHIYFRPDAPSANDYFPALMLVVVACVVAALAERIRKKEVMLRVVNEQLRASEQQLRAVNQQLQASEQQIRTTNQQLQANGQQLRAANEQLRASEQQLKAANQQLKASEQQLRAANKQLRAEVTERKRAEEKIKASLKEKEVLLKEIHHRVKNNMQVISSILNLQSKQIKDEQALKIFMNGQSRIRSMALVHEKLYESEDLAKIDFAEYIRSTTSYLFSLHGISEAVRLNIDIEDIFLDINTAIPCGLIINELVSNALKYAFPDGREGEIRIGLYSDKDDKLTLTIKDNGIGFPKDMDFRKTESLGMQLVIMLAEQIEGTVELDRSEGTTFTITFEKPKSKDGEAIK